MAAKAAMRIAETGERALSKRIGFTADALQRATCSPGKDRSWLYDSKSPLALMVTAAGGKAFYVYRKVAGRPQRVRLGAYPDITIEQARKLAQVTVGDIAKGINPMTEKRQARAKGMTFGELFKWYLDNHAKPQKRSWRDDEVRYEKHLKRLASRRLVDIEKSDLLSIHRRVSEETSPTTANRVLALVSVMFNKAAALLNWKAGNPTEGVERFSEKSRERFLTPEEMPRFLAAVESEPSANWKDFFKLCLFAGARSGNVKSMRWDELDLTSATWRIPEDKAKGKETMMVHLPPLAVKILTDRKEAAQAKARDEYEGEGEPIVNPWVFPSFGKTGHAEEPKKAWAALLKRAEISDLRIHDLRRSLGSWAVAGGASLPIIGKMLGHRNESTTAIYARLQLDPVRESVDAATAAMMKAGKKAKKDKAK